jgi:release factor glutamine methyltransferase
MSRATAASTVRDALGAATDAIAAAGSDSARLDAELLLAEASGLDRTTIAAQPETALEATAARRFGELVRRRVRREPVAYILGRKGFRAIELQVDRRVLIPRPETELLVEVAVGLRPKSVLDIGTGSGAVALAVADELPETSVVATDLSQAALSVAWGNAERLGLADRVRFMVGSLPEGPGGDLLLANLPYVSEAEWEGLAPEIREFEPREALVPGPTGLEAIEAVATELGRRGDRSSAVALEVGAGQAPAVAELLRAAGYERVEGRPDLAGIERVVVARRR